MCAHVVEYSLKIKIFNVVAFVVSQPMKIKSIKLVKWFSHYFYFHFFSRSIKLCWNAWLWYAKFYLNLWSIKKKKETWKNNNYKTSIIDHRSMSVQSISVNIMKFWSAHLNFVGLHGTSMIIKLLLSGKSNNNKNVLCSDFIFYKISENPHSVGLIFPER